MGEAAARIPKVSGTSSGLVFDAASSRPTISIISMMDPRRIWAARWLRIGKVAPGCYTLAVSEAFPEEMQFLCQDERVQYVPLKRI